MTQNPFEALGGGGEPGGFDLEGLLQQAQQMQQQLESAQERLAEARIDGTVGGGAVRIAVDPAGIPWVVTSAHNVWMISPKFCCGCFAIVKFIAVSSYN